MSHRSFPRLLTPSPNFGPRPDGVRPDMIVLHYTETDSADEAIAMLRDPRREVSAHYLIDDDGAVYVLVDEGHRAWHAGDAHWAGETDVNGVSIGIELRHAGHGAEGISPPPYSERLMASLLELCADVVSRHAIPPRRILGHSDVAPRRKIDPGEFFDWGMLASRGFGIEAAASAAEGTLARRGDRGDAVRRARRRLVKIGYEARTRPSEAHEEEDEFGEVFECVVRAFQRRYRRERVDGILDRGTSDAIESVSRGGLSPPRPPFCGGVTPPRPPCFEEGRERMIGGSTDRTVAP